MYPSFTPKRDRSASMDVVDVPAKRYLEDGYDGKRDDPSKAAEGRRAHKLSKLGLAETVLAPVTPKWYWTSQSTQDAILRPNYTFIQKQLEGTAGGSNHGGLVNTDMQTTWFQPSDGKYGLLQYRGNLGPYNVEDASGTVKEFGLGCLALPSQYVSGKNTFVRKLHLKCQIKYMVADPQQFENILSGGVEQIENQLPPMRIRFMMVRVKRNKLGLPLYTDGETRGYTNPMSNIVGNELLLDPVGVPFGVNQDNIPNIVEKRQTAKMHFDCPVQKKFFDVLCSHDFVLGPSLSKVKNSDQNATSAYTPGRVIDTAIDRPSVKNINITIPINELVHYVDAPDDEQPGSATQVKMKYPKDLNVFDTKIVCYAYPPQDWMDDWQKRLTAFRSGPTDLSWSTCPHIQFHHFGVLECTDDV